MPSPQKTSRTSKVNTPTAGTNSASRSPAQRTSVWPRRTRRGSRTRGSRRPRLLIGGLDIAADRAFNALRAEGPDVEQRYVFSPVAERAVLAGLSAVRADRPKAGAIFQTVCSGGQIIHFDYVMSSAGDGKPHTKNAQTLRSTHISLIRQWRTYRFLSVTAPSEAEVTMWAYFASRPRL